MDVNVVPRDRERVLRHQAVLVEDGKITATGRELKLPKDVRIIEGNYVDTRQDLAVQLAHGITTMLDMGEARYSFVGCTPAVARGEVPGPRAVDFTQRDRDPDTRPGKHRSAQVEAGIAGMSKT